MSQVPEGVRALMEERRQEASRAAEVFGPPPEHPFARCARCGTVGLFDAMADHALADDCEAPRAP